jgi:hypothetical protein
MLSLYINHHHREAILHYSSCHAANHRNLESQYGLWDDGLKSEAQAKERLAAMLGHAGEKAYKFKRSQVCGPAE